jgi:hypothetical protein
VHLDAGALTLELRGAKAWRICRGGNEVWHGIAFLFRDADWGTPEPVVDDVESSVRPSRFTLTLTGHFPVTPRVDFRLRLEGGEGCISVAAEAVPSGDIQASRLGLCVMHPMSVCGAAIEVEHIDGRISRSTFPTLIPPWPPFMLIRAIRHEYAPGAFARCTFEGDAFELEDQRNNSDASFKTYSRSNLMPRPYWLRAGVPARQSVELRLEAPDAAMPRTRRATTPSAVRVHVGTKAGAPPKVGIEIAPHDARASAIASLHPALARLQPAHLHLALDAGSLVVDWVGVKRLLESAGATLRLDVGVDYARPEPLDTLCRSLRDAGIAPASVAIFPSEGRCLDAARRAFPGAAIGGGTPHFFVQLNRIERLGACDFLTFTTSPIVHGADDDTVMLTLQSLPSMIDTLRASYPEARFAVGPSTIGVRRSPLGKQPETDGMHRVALARDDPRCRGLFGAAWVAGYAAQLAPAGIEGLTLMSLMGASGILVDGGDSAVTPTPAYWALERLCRAVGMHDVVVSEPSRVAAIAADSRDGQTELLVANLTPSAVDVEIDGIGAWAALAMLDAEGWNTRSGAASDFWATVRRPHAKGRIRLEAYALASLA